MACTTQAALYYKFGGEGPLTTGRGKAPPASAPGALRWAPPPGSNMAELPDAGERGGLAALLAVLLLGGFATYLIARRK